MFIQYRIMRFGLVVLGVLLLAGSCEERNPKKCDDSNHCPDPSLPFCDVDGAVAGVPRECVAVSCTAEAFEACRGDQELRCNTTGDNFDVVKCELGCESSSGCRSCEPNQTRCTNGRVDVCDAGGNIVSMETCALGCYEDQPRCRDIDPSNGLAAVLDEVTTPADLDLIDAIVQTETGIVKKLDGTPLPVTSFLVSSAPGIRVIIARNVRISNVAAYRNESDATSGGIYSSGPPLAIVATGAITVEGRITLMGGAGGIDAAPCKGGVGNGDTASGHSYWPGAGGGGHATAGAKGGAVITRAFGGTAGLPAGTETLVPLRGGCPGGGSGRGRGGGALQLSSRSTITVNGVIDVRGRTPLQTDGGGAGGGILIEAPKVVFTNTARLIAIGGGGGSGPSENHTVPDTLDDGMAAQGVACNPATQYCTQGGAGAAPGVSAIEGTSCNENTSLPTVGAGGGGGGLGRIRINTPDATYSKSSGAIEAGALTRGILTTR